MTSYQHDTSKGLYTPIESNGNGISSSAGTKNKKWLIAGFIIVVLGAIFFVVHKPAGNVAEDAIKKSDLKFNEDGSIMLVDDMSK